MREYDAAADSDTDSEEEQGSEGKAESSPSPSAVSGAATKIAREKEKKAEGPRKDMPPPAAAAADVAILPSISPGPRCLSVSAPLDLLESDSFRASAHGARAARRSKGDSELGENNESERPLRQRASGRQGAGGSEGGGKQQGHGVPTEGDAAAAGADATKKPAQITARPKIVAKCLQPLGTNAPVMATSGFDVAILPSIPPARPRRVSLGTPLVDVLEEQMANDSFHESAHGQQITARPKIVAKILQPPGTVTFSRRASRSPPPPELASRHTSRGSSCHGPQIPSSGQGTVAERRRARRALGATWPLVAGDPDEPPNSALAPIAVAHQPPTVDALLDQLIGRPLGGAW